MSRRPHHTLCVQTVRAELLLYKTPLSSSHDQPLARLPKLPPSKLQKTMERKPSLAPRTTINIASQLSEINQDDEKHMQTLFNTIDQDQDGSVTFEEFKKMYAGMRQKFAEDAQVIMDAQAEASQSKRRNRFLSICLCTLSVFLVLSLAGNFAITLAVIRMTEALSVTGESPVLSLRDDRRRLQEASAQLDSAEDDSSRPPMMIDDATGLAVQAPPETPDLIDDSEESYGTGLELAQPSVLLDKSTSKMIATKEQPKIPVPIVPDAPRRQLNNIKSIELKLPVLFNSLGQSVPGLVPGKASQLRLDVIGMDRSACDPSIPACDGKKETLLNFHTTEGDVLFFYKADKRNVGMAFMGARGSLRRAIKKAGATTASATPAVGALPLSMPASEVDDDGNPPLYIPTCHNTPRSCNQQGLSLIERV